MKERIKNWLSQDCETYGMLGLDEKMTRGESLLCCAGIVVFLLLLGVVGGLERAGW